jgi:hypothetical protein
MDYKITDITDTDITDMKVIVMNISLIFDEKTSFYQKREVNLTRVLTVNDKFLDVGDAFISEVGL